MGEEACAVESVKRWWLLALLLVGCGGHGSSASGSGGAGGGGGAGAGGGSGQGGLSGAAGACTPAAAGAAGSAVDVSWANWPMPNGHADVALGAPNAQSYAINGDGTVTDKVTGLMWQETVPATTYTSPDAIAYCPTLTLGGHCDWRLPSLIELASLLDFSVVAPAPTIDQTAFPATPAAGFWSSTPEGGISTLYWLAYFDSGFATGDLPATAYHARCVRSTGATAPANRYTIAGGTVFDNATKLTWQQTPPTTAYTWADAKTYCASAAVRSALGGTGWRLPTIKELLTIVDYSGYAPYVDPTAFPGTPASAFWSSSPEAGSTGGAWDVSFGNPTTHVYTILFTDSARCVR